MDDKQISSLSVTQWNIKGLHDPIFSCKLQSTDLLNSLNKYDINILTETWGCSYEVIVPNFETKIVPPNKMKNKKSGRASGGVTVLYRKYLKPKLEFIKICKNYIWVKIKN